MHRPPWIALAVLLALPATASGQQCLVPDNLIVSGGVAPGGIPALTTPEVVSAAEGDLFLQPDDLVLGVEAGGEARAYPHGILWWHEIVNDILGGVPIAVTYCPLTGSGLVFDPVYQGRVLSFNTSGLLFDNNLIMFDQNATGSLWSQMRAQVICGELKGFEPELLAVVQSTWAAWKALHPETSVVSFNTGFNRNYTRYPYGTYDQLDNNQLLFPQSFIDTRRPMKELVLGIRHEGLARAYPFLTLAELGPHVAVNDNVNGRPVLVVFDRDGQMALPFDRRLIDPTLGSGDDGEPASIELSFDVVETESFPFLLRDRETGTLWSLLGQAVEGPLAGARLAPIRTFVAMWFAWASFNPGTEIYGEAAPAGTP